MFMALEYTILENDRITLYWSNGRLHNTALKDDGALYMKKLGEDYYILLKKKYKTTAIT